MSPAQRRFEPDSLRKTILRMAHRGQSVHVPCAFSLVEIVSCLYSEFVHHNPADPRDPDRDYLVLSKGHGVMAMYACFLELGWLTQAQIDSYFSDGSELRGLAEADIPGLEATCGSLGHGLPIAAGIALGLKKQGRDRRVFCIVGDGEMNEGSMWEALLIASHHRLDNLTIIVDANGFQAMGRTDSIMSLEPLTEKLRAFGFLAEECDGHDSAAISASLRGLLARPSAPHALVARTVKGKGISFMENDNSWHYTRVDAPTYARALAELDAK